MQSTATATGTFGRLVRLIERRYESFFPPGQGITFALQQAGKEPHVFGPGEPEVTLVLHDKQAVAALGSMDRTTICEAYMDGSFDIEGDITRILAMRNFFPDRHPLRFAWRFAQPFIFGQVSSDKKWIAQHYDYDQDFYLLWLDRRHRCYSQGLFAHDDESLEDAMTRKLDTAIEAAEIRPGDRVLDIGGGWGAFLEYAGKKGIHVTSLTISQESEKFLNGLIARDGLPCRALREHFFEHQPSERYDAIVNLGVTEHLPDYQASLAKYQTLLKPGRKMYLDASAARVKYSVSDFLEKYIYPGNGSLLCLQDYLTELAKTPFELLSVANDRHNYYLTSKHWAQRLDDAREEVERRWGKTLYRKFQLYLWGCADGFQRDMITAYRWVMYLPRSAG